jgi:catechol 2,3-dioxygenase-like lactoylglutathione lyase family enzyme
MTDMRLELISLPVTDVDRAKAFYTEKAGFVADHDHRLDEQTRFVQLTPPGSACSIAFGTGQAASTGGPVQLQVVVDDVHAVRSELLARGIDPGEVQVFPYGSFVFFGDPDGNRWAVQELPPRP